MSFDLFDTYLAGREGGRGGRRGKAENVSPAPSE